MRRILLSFLVLLTSLTFLAVAAKAAFDDNGVVKGTTITVGSADIKLLDSLSGGFGQTNLLDEKQGPAFSGIYPGWEVDYPIKLYNNGSVNMLVSSESNYTTADDPQNIREYVYVEVFDWDDVDGDGVVGPLEISSTSIAKKTLLKWKTEGITFDQLDSGEVKGLLLRFSSPTIPDTKQGQSGVYDFIFSGTTDGAVQ